MISDRLKEEMKNSGEISISIFVAQEESEKGPVMLTHSVTDYFDIRRIEYTTIEGLPIVRAKVPAKIITHFAATNSYYKTEKIVYRGV